MTEDIQREKERLVEILRNKSDMEMALLFWYVFGWMSKTKGWDNFKECFYSALTAVGKDRLKLEIDHMLEEQGF